MNKAAESAADALIIDLEDSVAPSARPAARELVAEFLHEPRQAECWVRINPLDGEDWRRDLEAIVPAAPYGVVLPKASGGEDMRVLAAALDAQEDACGDGCGITRILPIVTEKPAALFRLHEYAGSSSRLAGITWGAEDLSAALGASRNRDSSGEWLPPYQLARSLALIGAAAASVRAIDTVFTDFRDSRGLAEYAERARQDGFSGMLAIHPAQIAPINDAFRPSADEIERARRIVKLFAERPEQAYAARRRDD